MWQLVENKIIRECYRESDATTHCANQLLSTIGSSMATTATIFFSQPSSYRFGDSSRNNRQFSIVVLHAWSGMQATLLLTDEVTNDETRDRHSLH